MSMCVRAKRGRRLVHDYRLVGKMSWLLGAPDAFWPSLPQISRFWMT